MRGTAANEPVVSQARTREWDEGYDRTFGADRKPQRGRWVWDPDAKRLVDASTYQPPPQAVNAPILAGRFYENTAAIDGTDIGSRAKHRRYMKEHGLTIASDYTNQWKRDEEKRKAAREGHIPSKTRREALERAMYRISKP